MTDARIDAEFAEDIATGRLVWVNTSLGIDRTAFQERDLAITEYRENLASLLQLDPDSGLSLNYLVARSYDRHPQKTLDSARLFEEALSNLPRSPTMQALVDAPIFRIYDLTGFSTVVDCFEGLHNSEFVNPEVRFRPPANDKLQVVYPFGRLKESDVIVPLLSHEQLGPDAKVWLNQMQANCATSPLLLTCDALEEDWLVVEPLITAGSRERRYVASNSLSDQATQKLKLADFQLLLDVDRLHKSHLSNDSPAVRAGHQRLSASRRVHSAGRSVVQVSSLKPMAEAEDPERFLRGFVPRWPDVVAPEFVDRDISQRIVSQLSESIANDNPVNLLVTGRAGAGKTGTLMDCAIRMSDSGLSVGWIDRDVNQKLRDLRKHVRDLEFDVLFIDDIDIWGDAAHRMVAEFTRSGATRIVASIRGTRRNVVENLAPKFTVLDHPAELHADELSALVDSIEHFGLDGNLPHQGKDERIRFLESDSDYLLACLMKAVSGRQFNEIVTSELRDLGQDQKALYELICFLSSIAHEAKDLAEEDLLQLLGVGSFNRAQIALEFLIEHGLVSRSDFLMAGVRCKHRVIADTVLHEISADLRLILLSNSVQFFAARARDLFDDDQIDRRYLIRLMNNRVLTDQGLTRAQGRALYRSIAQHLRNDYHYWLQFASFEVEHDAGKGDGLELASSYIGKAKKAVEVRGWRSDYLVDTKAAEIYLLQALRGLGQDELQSSANSAMHDLIRITTRHGADSPHTYTVLTNLGVSYLETCHSDGADVSKFVDQVDSVLSTAQRRGEVSSFVLENIQKARARLSKLRSDGFQFPILT